jgi:hypothetical protein
MLYVDQEFPNRFQLANKRMLVFWKFVKFVSISVGGAAAD